MLAGLRTPTGIAGILAGTFVVALLVWNTSRIRDSQPYESGASPQVIEICLEPGAHQLALLERIRSKDAVAWALLRGELNLSQAANHFRELSDRDSASLARLQYAFPDAALDELWHQQVMGFARNLVRRHPNPYKSVLAKLEAELVALFPKKPISPALDKDHFHSRSPYLEIPPPAQTEFSGRIP